VLVRDQSVKVDTKTAEKIDPSKPGHVGAPFSGVVTLQVAEGEKVDAGAPVATIEAMKMEAAITATVGGVVKRVAIPSPGQVDAGDLIVEIESD
jgi:pyruvate carboxylase